MKKKSSQTNLQANVLVEELPGVSSPSNKVEPNTNNKQESVSANVKKSSQGSGLIKTKPGSGTVVEMDPQ